MDEDYLKMILALPDEFFEGWEWKEGDRFILINRKKGKIVDYQDGTIGDSVLENGEVGYIWTSGYSGEYGFEKYDSEIRPILSQEQLQSMIKKHVLVHNVKLKDVEILKRVTDWHIRRDPEHKLDKSTKCLFLEVLQWLNDKTWDGEAWL